MLVGSKLVSILNDDTNWFPVFTNLLVVLIQVPIVSGFGIIGKTKNLNSHNWAELKQGSTQSKQILHTHNNQTVF